MTVTVLLVDDFSELREVVRQALALRGGFEVVGEAADGAAAIAEAGERQPDVVVLDLGLPDLAGREVVTRIRSASPQTKIVIYTGSILDDRSDVLTHVAGYVRKNQELGYLIDLLVDLGRSERLAATIRLGPDRRDVARGRRFIAEQCRRWGCADVIERSALVVTELVTNALVHAGTECELRARMAGEILRLEVVDEGAGVPDVQIAGGEDEHGRGLVLVSALSTAWGVEARPEGGKLVWAELVSAPGPEPDAASPLSSQVGAAEGTQPWRRAGAERTGTAPSCPDDEQAPPERLRCSQSPRHALRPRARRRGHRAIRSGGHGTD